MGHRTELGTALKKFWAWAKNKPGDALSIFLIIVLAILSLISAFASVLTELLLPLIALVISSSAALLIVTRNELHNVGLQASAASTSDLIQISPDLISTRLNDLLSRARSWRFRGGSARWQRKTVLPHLANIRDFEVQYEAIIPSPFDLELCEQYARYRETTREPGDREAIQTELLSFIYAVALWKSTSRLMPSIALLSTFSPLRVDSSLEGMIITVADKSQAGLWAQAKNWYAIALEDEMNLQKKMLEIEIPQVVVEADPFAPEVTRDFFTKLLELNSTTLDPGAISQMTNEDWIAVARETLFRCER